MEYEPVAYDVSIVVGSHGFTVIIREDDNMMCAHKSTLEEAQEVMESLKPDVFCAPDVPWSVFCPRRMSNAIARQESQR